MSAAPNPVQIPERVVAAPVQAPVQPEPRKPKIWIALVVALIVAGGGIYAWRANVAKQQAAATATAVKTTTAAIGTLEQTMRIAGQTSARQFVNVTAPILRGPEGGRDMVIISVVPSGAWVKKGQEVARIDGQTLQDHVDDLKDTIEAAEADVRKARSEQMIEWETLQQTLRVAQSEYDKAKLEYAAATVRTDIEQQLLKLTLDETEARYKQQQQDLAHKRAAHAAQIRILELTKERHVRHRNRHMNDLDKFTIRASMDGLAVMSQIWRGGEMGQFQQGDRVFPGQLFMKVVNPKSMQLEATVNQAVSSELRLGQSAQIKFDAFPGLTLPAKIHSLGALAVGGWRQNYYIRNVPVRLNIEGSDARVIPDLSAAADVLIARAENKLLVPLAAVESRGDKHFASVKTGDEFKEREVKLGMRNATHAVVEAGLSAGDVLRLN